MLTKEENESLTRVGPGTPAGEMLRRYWHPIAFITELKGMAAGSAGFWAKISCCFATTKTGWGLLQLRCSHRGTSLEFGHLEDGGLRCCYHGWLYDVEGQILGNAGRAGRQHVLAARSSSGLQSSRVGRCAFRVSWPRAGLASAAIGMCWCGKTACARAGRGR